MNNSSKVLIAGQPSKPCSIKISNRLVRNIIKEEFQRYSQLTKLHSKTSLELTKLKMTGSNLNISSGTECTQMSQGALLEITWRLLQQNVKWNVKVFNAIWRTHQSHNKPTVLWEEHWLIESEPQDQTLLWQDLMLIQPSMEFIDPMLLASTSQTPRFQTSKHHWRLKVSTWAHKNM